MPEESIFKTVEAEILDEAGLETAQYRNRTERLPFELVRHARLRPATPPEGGAPTVDFGTALVLE